MNSRGLNKFELNWIDCHEELINEEYIVEKIKAIIKVDAMVEMIKKEIILEKNIK